MVFPFEMPVKIDAPLMTMELADAGRAARRLEEAGFDGAFTYEGPHDPFFPLALAAHETERIELATAVAIAFARNPMILANIGHDLQRLSKGRFILGLGSQIRPHIERRFSSVWSRPAARMRELVLAIRAIWQAWEQSERLDFRGEFYTHTLMTPVFDPGPNPFGTPRIFLAGVGPRMTEVAGEVADGFLVHPLHSPRTFAELTRPALAAGRRRAGESLDGWEISAQVLVVTGSDEVEWKRARRAVRAQLAFYASTPAYRPVLECHGWGDLQPEANRLSKEGRWAEMADLVDDEMLETFAVCAAPEEVGDALAKRCDYATRVSPSMPYEADATKLAPFLSPLRV